MASLVCFRARDRAFVEQAPERALSQPGTALPLPFLESRTVMVSLVPEQAADAFAIEGLLDRSFGPGRFAKTAYRLREGTGPVAGLSFVARHGGALVGSVRYWPLAIAGSAGLLLGPLVVDPLLRGRGVGAGLMIVSLAAARRAGEEWVLLVGDEPYYARVGFRAAEPGRFTMPGPVDPRRLLLRELVPGALEGLMGPVVARAR